MSFTGIDLLVTIAESTPGAGDAGSILIKSTLGTPYEQGLERIAFADGTTWDAAQIRTKAIASAQTNGNDTITGFATGDTYTGGKGNDVINGGEGSDTYVYARGDGNDTITESTWGGTSDQLVFTNINPSDVTLARNGTDLTIIIADSTPGAGDGGSVLLKDTLDGTYERGVEKVVFADGTIWTRANMISNVAYFAGSNGNDTITGTDNSDSQILAGLGNDILKGLAGSDTYVYLSGDGNDTVDDKSGSITDVDVLKLTDLNVGDLTFSRTGTHARITVNSTGHVITLDEQFYSETANWGVEKIEFADGTVWDRAQIKTASISHIYGTSGNDTLVGTALNDVFNGGLGDDRINSGTGSDTYIYASGDGTDYIDDESDSTTDIDVLRLTDLNVEDLTFSRSGSHVKISINSTGHAITLDEQVESDVNYWGIEKIEFADGTVWDRTQIKAAAISRINGSSAGETLYGTSLDDVFNGGLGDDRFNSGAGSDTYIYASGDGTDYIDDESGSTTDVDVMKLTDLNVGDLTFSRAGSHAKITVNSTGHVITLDEQFYSETANWGIEKIEFADGTVWDRTQIKLAAISRINGSTGGETLYGTSLDDVFNGGLGDDRFNSGAGSDTYIYSSGDGTDYIDDESGSTTDVDVLKLTDLNVGDLTFSRAGSHAKITVNSTGHVITLDEQFYSETANWGIEKIEFADGTVWDRSQIKAAAISRINGTSSGETLNGTSLDDVFNGGLGDDRFESGAGSDAYVYAKGDGNDRIVENSGSNVEIDTLRFDDLTPADVEFSRFNDTLLLKVVETGHTITVDWQFYSDASNWGIEKIEFADGTVWDRAQIKAAAISRINGTSGGETLNGTSLDDVFNAGLGDDRFESGSGSDTYVYAKGDGNDRIVENSGSKRRSTLYASLI
ncbi:calcium-binding protein [Agrobacterium sp. DSM 25558]|uniref:calcium-binding protein n=1 Tax=Agrobacterium sp. DSM 25558 TaxID=1907665 RepID=UPI001356659E|nr:calcium-binding protein [Agrobacterium sp. DSM 25558]